MLSGLAWSHIYAKHEHTTTPRIITGVTPNYFLSILVLEGQTVRVCACV